MSELICSWVGRRMEHGTDLTFSIQFLRDVRQFFGTSFKIAPAEPDDPECKQLVYSCYGTGYTNANRTLA